MKNLDDIKHFRNSEAQKTFLGIIVWLNKQTEEEYALRQLLRFTYDQNAV